MFRSIVINAFDNFKNVDKKYYVKENSFNFTKKLSFENTLGFILNSNGRNLNVESYDFFSRINEDYSFSVSNSAISQRRQNINPDVFVDLNKKLISDAYNELDVVDTDKIFKYKRMRILAVDSSILTLYNYSKLLEQYCTKLGTASKPLLRARLSCFTDVNTNMIVNSNFSVKATSEPEIAIKQIEELEDTIDLKNTIILGDRGYDSISLMINIMEHNSYFIIRLKENKFKKERKNLTGKDETIQINLNKSRLRNVSNEEIKEKYYEKGRIDLRIIEIPLESKTEEGEEKVEYLITNLTKDMVPYEYFKELYHKRWSVEIEFDRLKNILEIENFSGRKEITIKQDLFAKIFLYNMAMILRLDAKPYIKRRTSKNNRLTYQINKSTLLGIFKKVIIDLLKVKSRKRMEEILKQVLNVISKDLSSTVKDPPKTERKVRDRTNKFPGNIKRA